MTGVPAGVFRGWAGTSANDGLGPVKVGKKPIEKVQCFLYICIIQEPKECVMDQFCLNCEETFSSPLLKERNKSLGRNFLFTVLAFAALCLVSYLIAR